MNFAGVLCKEYTRLKLNAVKMGIIDIKNCIKLDWFYSIFRNINKVIQYYLKIIKK